MLFFRTGWQGVFSEANEGIDDASRFVSIGDLQQIAFIGFDGGLPCKRAIIVQNH